MEREILFRGKSVDNGEWLIWNCYGIVQSPNKYAPKNDKRGTRYPIISFKIIPETIGEYTGITDKNGKKIFEGDIVKITDKTVGYTRLASIEFGNPNGLYSWGWQLKPISKEPFAVDILHWVDMEESGAFIEVIGNVFENAEVEE